MSVTNNLGKRGPSAKGWEDLMPGFEGAEAHSLEALVGNVMEEGGGRLGALLETTELSYGSPIDLFAN